MRNQGTALSKRLPALLGLVGVGCLLIAGGLYLVTAEFDRKIWSLLIVGLGLLAISGLESWEAILKAGRGRTARYGSNTVVMSIAFVGILALLNILAAKHVWNLDLTANKQYTLSPQTIQILKRIKEPLQVTAFYSQQQSDRQAMQDLLKEYQAHSDKIQVRFVDPDRQPTLARQYQIASYGTTVFEYNGRKQKVMGSDEQDVTSAILRVISNESKKVYFLTGHGEMSIDSSDRRGGSAARRALEADNYQVSSLALATSGKVPDDTSVLIIAAPQKPFLEQEKSALKDYLKRGGRSLILNEPGTVPDAAQLLQDWGVDIGTGLVVDEGSPLLNDVLTPLITHYRWSEITKDLPMTIFPTVTSVTPRKELPKGVTVSTIAETTDKSWLEKDTKVAHYDEGIDTKGPISIAVTVETEKQAGGTTGNEKAATEKTANHPQTRMVVVGDVDFATNAFLDSVGNRDFFLNSVDWLAQSEDLIGIRAKPPQDRRLFLTGTEMNLIFYSSVIFLPLAVLLAGGAVWWTRR
ncbi:MAG: GldG family protein [Chloroflexi bacterium]|nr:GldG family protein [Chloroflexota bacterium]MCL5076258.1 GldG family protein [Chloroflexota bacterium]